MAELNFDGGTHNHKSRLSQNGQAVSHFFGQSSFATHVVADAKNVVVVDKDVDLSLLGPLGCGMITGSATVLNFLKPDVGSSIAIFGAGGVGLSAVMAAKVANCYPIIVVDANNERLQLAQELGSTYVLNGKDVDVVAVQKITHGGTLYSVRTTGVAPVIQQSIHVLRVRGTAAIVGIGGDVTLHFFHDVLMYCKTIVGVVESDAVPQVFIPKLVQLYKDGKFPFDKLVKFYKFS